MNAELMKHVEDFDNGKEVKTVIMGGITNGYEIAIQTLAIEIMRILMVVKIPEKQEAFQSLLSKAEKGAFEVVKDYGYSGAQVGAAKNIAAIYYRQTPSGALSKMDDLERIITIKKAPTGEIILSKKIGED